MNVREIYTPKRMTANGMIVPIGGQIGGFFCTTAGTLQITVGEASGGADMISSFSVAAGTMYPFNLYCETGAYAVLGGGAVGTFLK
jgi:hypothetical protein